jgi:hypothetical protein
MTKLNLELFRSAQFAISSNGPYFQNKIEKVPFESRQEKKSPIRRKYDTIFAFPNDR